MLGMLRWRTLRGCRGIVGLRFAGDGDERDELLAVQVDAGDLESRGEVRDAQHPTSRRDWGVVDVNLQIPQGDRNRGEPGHIHRSSGTRRRRSGCRPRRREPRGVRRTDRSLRTGEACAEEEASGLFEMIPPGGLNGPEVWREDVPRILLVVLHGQLVGPIPDPARPPVVPRPTPPHAVVRIPADGIPGGQGAEFLLVDLQVALAILLGGLVCPRLQCTPSPLSWLLQP
jgi:hypothetical protein